MNRNQTAFTSASKPNLTLRAIKAALSASGLALVLVAPAAEAFVDNTYPGIQCVHHSGGVPTAHYGMLENRTNQTSVVNCPVPLSEGAEIDDVSVLVWNVNTGTPVTCILRVTELAVTFPNGYQVTSETQDSVLLNDWNPLHFNPITVNPQYTTHAFIRCELPPGNAGSYSKIGSYKTNDFGIN